MIPAAVERERQLFWEVNLAGAASPLSLPLRAVDLVQMDPNDPLLHRKLELQLDPGGPVHHPGLDHPVVDLDRAIQEGKDRALLLPVARAKVSLGACLHAREMGESATNRM